MTINECNLTTRVWNKIASQVSLESLATTKSRELKSLATREKVIAPFTSTATNSTVTASKSRELKSLATTKFMRDNLIALFTPAEPNTTGVTSFTSTAIKSTGAVSIPEKEYPFPRESKVSEEDIEDKTFQGRLKFPRKISQASISEEESHVKKYILSNRNEMIHCFRRRAWDIITARTRKHMVSTVTDRKGGSFNYIEDETTTIQNKIIYTNEETKNLFKLLKSKARLSEEDFPIELLKSSLTKGNGMVKNVAIKPAPRSTSTKVEIMVRDQKSKKSRPSHSTSSGTRNVPKILSYLQVISYLQ